MAVIVFPALTVQLTEIITSFVYNLLYANGTCTVGFMYLFLPALTPILVLITCTQRNTTPYVVVSGVELFASYTFTVQLYAWHGVLYLLQVP